MFWECCCNEKVFVLLMVDCNVVSCYYGFRFLLLLIIRGFIIGVMGFCVVDWGLVGVCWCDKFVV